MPRAVSPARSEAEVDIFDSLTTDQVQTEHVHKDRQAQLNEGFGFLDNVDDDDDEAFIALKQAASYRKTTNLKGKTGQKSGGFQSMGLNAKLLGAILRKGFNQPTPIQRKAIPLVIQRRDVVGMARTGSGKTAAFVIPMIERLKAHSAMVGARALILSPSRELALQTLKVVKEFGKGTDLKCVLLVGGDSLEEQFGFMTTNPDIIIATPGRFLHLKVEMNLSLSSIKYVVFDEADRLFEMGFAAQLTEILHALPASRQTLLFSATLPASLVEFARAGLQDPSLVRLDAETKVSPKLESAFFGVKAAEKEAALLHILHDIIKMPTGVPEAAQHQPDKSKKRKRGNDNPNAQETPTEHSTIVFAATKHHVEYLSALLREQGFAVSYVYGSLDQTARMIHVDNFRRGKTNILVVTDVAARGIDIPVLANVINYDFPPQPKVFVHRVGRTARADKEGWSFSIMQDADAPYLIDLQLFLGRKLILGREGGNSPSYREDMVVGALQRSEIELNVEWLNKLLKENEDIKALRQVAGKAEKLYIRTRNSASSQSAKRAKEIVVSKGWNELHPLFGHLDDDADQARNDMLARIGNWRPKETIFEVRMGKKEKSNPGAEVMRKIRAKIIPKNRVEKEAEPAYAGADIEMGDAPSRDDVSDAKHADTDDESSVDHDELPAHDSFDEDDVASDSDLEVTVSKHADYENGVQKDGKKSSRDSEFFMSYTPRTINANEEKGYSVNNGGPSFVEAARNVTMDLTNDDGAKSFGEPARSKMRWDKKQSKYVSTDNDADGSKGVKTRMIRGESGVKIAASFQSGRFDRWRRAHRLGKMPHVGEQEKGNLPRLTQNGGPGGEPGGERHFKHKQERAPKEADKYRDDFHVRKKRVAEAKEKRIGKFKDGEGSRKEIKSGDDIVRARKVQEMKRAKNARPAKRGGKR